MSDDFASAPAGYVLVPVDLLQTAAFVLGVECFDAERDAIRALLDAATKPPVSDDLARDARIKALEDLLSDIKDEIDGFSGFDGSERAVFIELSGAIDAAMGSKGP